MCLLPFLWSLLHQLLGFVGILGNFDSQFKKNIFIPHNPSYCRWQSLYTHLFGFSCDCHSFCPPTFYTHSFVLSLTHWCSGIWLKVPPSPLPSSSWASSPMLVTQLTFLSPMPSSPPMGFYQTSPQLLTLVPIPQTWSWLITELCQPLWCSPSLSHCLPSSLAQLFGSATLQVISSLFTLHDPLTSSFPSSSSLDSMIQP